MTAAKDATIHERMVAILAELPPIGKDQKNVQQNFMFRGHDDVLNALNPMLAKHGVFVLPHVLARETSQRTTKSGTSMFEVSLLVEYTFHGAAGDTVRGSAWGEGTDMGDKATSKAMTMAFKSVLNQAFAISNKENADPDALTPEETVAAAKPAVAHTVDPAKVSEQEKTLLALNDEYAALVPEFKPEVVSEKMATRRNGDDYTGWLRKQIEAFENNLAAKKGEIAAEAKFPIPKSPAEQKAAA